MEFELVNDILTSTVSKLFLNQIKHLNYFRTEEAVKSEIPKSSKREESTPVVVKASADTDLKSWKAQGKIKLEIAMKKLNIDEQRIKSPNLTNFGIDFLQAEKAKVKSELKKFDNEFIENFSRPPCKTEKEIMRPLYAYYKYLKKAIDVKKNEPKSKNKSQTTVNQPTGPNFSKFVKEEKVMSPNNYVIDKKQYSKNVEKNNNILVHNDSNPYVKKEITKVVKPDYQKLEKEYDAIKVAQHDLRKILQKFEKDFFQVNNRRVKYKNDLLPIQTEYDTYKANKERMKEIEDIIKSQKV
jgi:hypothetical protein